MTLNTKKLMKTFKQRDEEEKHGRIRYRVRLQSIEEAKKEIMEFYKSECKCTACDGSCNKKESCK